MPYYDLDKWKAQKKTLNLTLDDLVEKTGISRRTLSGLFSGKDPRYQNPTVATINAIEQALELAPTQDERAAGVVDTMRVSITAEEDNLLVLYREIGRKKGADMQRLFMEMGRLMLER